MWIYPFLLPKFSPVEMKPMTLYSLLNSIVNFGKEDKTNIYNLAEASRSTIFDFKYPLSDKIEKSDFECMILNHFMMRRIGFETPTQFKLQLNVKLNEIMPMYNKLFDSLDGWDLFNDGKTQTREINSSNNLESNSTTETTSDRRFSDTPQNKIQDIKDGSYISEYSFDTNNGSDSSNSKGNSTTNEVMKESPDNKIQIYKDFLESKQNVYTMIFKDLECLFYQLD